MWESIDADLTSRSGAAVGTAMQAMTDLIPLGRLETPTDVAGVVSFLASPDAAYVTGSRSWSTAACGSPDPPTPPPPDPEGTPVDLYLDTADRSLAEPLLRTGLFRGLTTNPTILERADLGVADVADVHAWAAATGVGEIFFQVWGRDVDPLVARGHELRELGPEVVVKLVASQAAPPRAPGSARRGCRPC